MLFTLIWWIETYPTPYGCYDTLCYRFEDFEPGCPYPNDIQILEFNEAIQLNLATPVTAYHAD